MKIVVGLGNPGEKYKNNRHNVGQMLVDYFLETYNTQLVTPEEKIIFKKNKYAMSEIAECKKSQVISYKLKGIILVKPLTFMNLSGQAVREVVKSYKLKVISDLVIIHDDLDIPLGKFKIQKGVGPLLHNGVSSIEQFLDSKDFLRVRIGIDNRTPDKSIDGETYVLQDFLPEEKKIVFELFSNILSRLKNDLHLKL
ncbi:hypothetical protein A2866_01975 [Candidatus Roizmanbacteria bacterium RIFCSPHIGHO2_01_FULL_39_8]|uniref:Peptidyl-tRNA hydrolase n=1 Tax=Candidatus Roizmanbacteria bacterium RIFCSPHIGHO2_01_FULL_39_8 TaxID=1802033 RepID=A0A1F7GIK2_9BACT|nr:MAG: hypothetical protein A2866_01975 [Candidatus Roizmanbacteria bacterium RIFCSPHIGHO2_01_FULL_39_8]